METQKVRIWHEGIELTSEVNQSEVLNPHLTQPKLSRTQQKKKNRFLSYFLHNSKILPL